MPGFGFTPDNGDEDESKGNNPFGFENFGEIFKLLWHPYLAKHLLPRYQRR
jgi:hypothetical protein